MLARNSIRTLRAPRTSTRSVSYSETGIFKDNAKKWWSGKEFQLLRGMNELRVPLIRNGLLASSRLVKSTKKSEPRAVGDSDGQPLAGFRIMDVGCGGGILSEPLARLGANVLGVDPVHESIVEAQQHAQADKTTGFGERLNYRNCVIDEVLSEPSQVEAFDAVVASEVLEHVRDIEGFLGQCSRAIKPNGSLFITTINQTPLSYLGVILFGEYILRQLPKGTHSYHMLVNLLGLKIMLERMGYHFRLVSGFMYEPITGRFFWTPVTLTHYAVHAVKGSSPIAGGKKTLPASTTKTSNKDVLLQFRQKRHYAAKAKRQNKQAKPKIQLTDDEMRQVVPIDVYKIEMDVIVNQLQEHFDKNLTTRMALLSVDNMEISLMQDSSPGGNLFKLKDVAQISRKGANLIVINLNAMPDAIKPTVLALQTQLGNANPQVEGNSIFLPLPRVTRDHREKLVETAKRYATQAKSEMRVLFASHSSLAKRQQTKASLSEDLVRNTIEFLLCHMKNKVDHVEMMLKTKTDDLLNQSND